MYLSPTRRGLGRTRRLGLVSTPVNGSLVYGSSPIPVRGTISRWGGNPPGGICPAWGCGPAPVRPVGPSYPVEPYLPLSPAGPITPPYSQMPANPGPGFPGGPSQPYSPGWWQQRSGSGSGINAQALAVAQALLATNPSLLTQDQFTMLQQAGLISGTLPYSSVSQINAPAGTPALPAVPVAAPATDIGSMLSQSFAGLPLYLWLIIGGGGAFLLSRSGGRR